MSRYIVYENEQERKDLDLNVVKKGSPFPRGLYSGSIYDDGSNNPLSAHYGLTQKGMEKVMKRGTAKETRLTIGRDIPSSEQLPDYFVRFGYGKESGGCDNGYCLGNFGGKWIVGENTRQSSGFNNPRC